MTTETALKIARQTIVANGVELIETIDGVRYTRPIPAGQPARLALANARRSLAERLVSGEVRRGA